jgi:TatD DNase family protein
VQQAVFREQIASPVRAGLPIVIHTREAEDDTFRILDEESASVGRVVSLFHGRSRHGTPRAGCRFHLSLAGIVSFPKALELQEVARMVPADRLLIETDSPFLAPVPHRGKRNEPAHVVRVAEVVASLRGTTVESVGQTTSDNFDRLFNP